jgi:FkbM family methyltransferase
MRLPFLKPEYLFRPTQLARRLVRAGRRERLPEQATVELPWGHRLECRPRESIGHALWHLGVYELPLTETLFRLIEPGETACDVGANLGYMTSVMVAAVGPRGRVFSFEPHPEVFARLERNVSAIQAAARARGGAPVIELHASALSDQAGSGTLYAPAAMQDNAGLSSLVPQVGAEIKIRLERWDDLPIGAENIGVLKLDTEGAELQVLRGAQAALRRRAFRDIVYEDHAAGPSEVAQCLESAGYTIFRVDRGFWHPRLRAPVAGGASRWEPPNFLATRDPERAQAKLRGAGWLALRSKPLGG